MVFCTFWSFLFKRFFNRFLVQDDARRKRLEREKVAREGRQPDTLRSPIVCIMGHVDTGQDSVTTTADLTFISCLRDTICFSLCVILYVFPEIFLHSGVTEACPVTTD